jgi:hypothetical protein
VQDKVHHTGLADSLTRQQASMFLLLCLETEQGSMNNSANTLMRMSQRPSTISPDDAKRTVKQSDGHQ